MPLPEPDAPLVIVSHVESLVAFHEHPDWVDTPTPPVVVDADTDRPGAEMV